MYLILSESIDSSLNTEFDSSKQQKNNTDNNKKLKSVNKKRPEDEVGRLSTSLIINKRQKKL